MEREREEIAALGKTAFLSLWLTSIRLLLGGCALFYHKLTKNTPAVLRGYS